MLQMQIQNNENISINWIQFVPTIRLYVLKYQPLYSNRHIALHCT